jgi:NADPH:quinone reductase-like Zn-dependent oxidoreductase
VGAAHVIASDEQDLVKEILGITGGKGARVVFDPVGGPIAEKLTKAIADFGILFILGMKTRPGGFEPPTFGFEVRDSIR